MRSRALVVLFVAMLAAPHMVAAQVGSSTDIITGTITDPDGKPVAGARVDVTSIETDVTRTKTTNEKGQYTILFPDGGGRYRVSVRMIGMASATFTLVREADEDRLVGNVRMSTAVTTLQAVEVRGSSAPPRGDRPEPGNTERTLSGEQLARLPIDPSDPNAIAALAPGVVSVDATDTTSAGFSVAGQRTDQNLVTLDGLTFGAAAVPQEAVRSTRVITNTYDVARGQFTGGQVATTTRGGTNTVAGSFNYSLRDPHLEWTDTGDSTSTFSNGYTQHQLSGGIGGALIRNKAFVFGSFQLRRRLDPMQSLIDADARRLAAFGVHPDSAARFFSTLQGFGMPVALGNIPDERTNDNLSTIVRVDYQLGEDHSLMIRGNWQGSVQKGSRISTLSLPHHGGSQSGNGGGAMVSLSSVLGSYLNEFRGSYTVNNRSSDPYLATPEGRVAVAGSLPSGALSIAELTFGGNTGLPTESSDHQLELSDELSWLSGGGAHRWKLGGLVNLTDFDQTAGSNRNGTFAFNSLADFATGMPASFTRSLVSGERSGGALNSAVYLGDTWRHGRALQVTVGARAEASRYNGAPALNTDVQDRFGVRTDRFPSELHVSPRVGVTWTIGGPTSGGDRGDGGGGRGQRGGEGGFGGGFGGGRGGGMFGAAGGAGVSTPFIVRAGVGEFRGRAPSQLFASAQAATGLPSSETQLICIGDVVPTPDWASYLADPSTIPTRCADGGLGTPPSQSSSRRNVTVIDPSFTAPRSWRASLGVSKRLGLRYNVSVDGSYALGTNLYGVRDLNFSATPYFTLAGEGNRPVFVPEASIVPTTGATTLAASRVHPEYGYVLAADSRLRSNTTQITLALTGTSFNSILWNASYTFMRSRDQSSFSGGSALGGFSSAPTAGNPNEPGWAPSDLERRHAFTGSVTWLAKSWLDVTSIVRLTAGSGFTPRVNTDINGDGARNDRAFIFDPSTTTDTALVNGMTRLLANAPANARACLESQLGRVADRNSCHNPWATSLDLQANVRPYLGATLQRRLQFIVTFVNPLTGIDQLLHGRDNLRGWGQPSYSDQTLLYVRGFDPARQSFIYQVNERFGSNAASRSAIRAPFMIGLQARLQVGPDRQREMMQGFVRGAAGNARGANGAGAGPGRGFDLRTMIDRIAPNPVAAIIERRDSLHLTDAQVTSLQSIADSLRSRNDALAAKLQPDAEKISSGKEDFASVFRRIQPQLQEARNSYLSAVQAAQKVLTPEQWEMLPASIRNPVLRGGGPGQRRGP